MIGALLKPISVSVDELRIRLKQTIEAGARLGVLTARYSRRKRMLVALVLFPNRGAMELWEAPIESDSYPAITPLVPQAHWFERSICDFFGIRAEGHPRFKSLILHDAWPDDFFPLAVDQTDLQPRKRYQFMEVRGEGVYEIPVGPIHAGIIEPGHFRFSCLGEVIQNLEIRLGYQHRGIERQLTEIPWKHSRFLAESASSDTTAGNALAHALAIEVVFLGVNPPEDVLQRRVLALEIERLASHLGDLAGICGDIGYSGGSAIFGCLRGKALGLAERLTGSRFQTAYIHPGGVSRNLPHTLRADMRAETAELSTEFKRAEPMLLDNSGALERMEGIGKVRPSLARDFGLVGPAGRASGSGYDVRSAFPNHTYGSIAWQPAGGKDGDVLARVRMRMEEVWTSLSLIHRLLENLQDHSEPSAPLSDELPADQIGAGIVELWRGELIHMIFTDDEGCISRYCIKDPSFNNWTGLAIAARGELVADFPLCNKSFGLSYSGNDL